MEKVPSEQGSTASAIKPKSADETNQGGLIKVFSSIGPKTITVGATNRLTSQKQALTSKKIFNLYVGICSALFIAFVEQSIIGTALNSITSDLGDPLNQSWILSASVLGSGAFQILWSYWSDIFNRRATLLFGMSIFMLATLGCALSRNMTELIVFRSLQGAGGSSLFVLPWVISADCTGLRERGLYQGMIEFVSFAGNGFAPLLGALFVEHSTWRWCFYFSLPVTAVSMFLIICLVPEVKTVGNLRQKFLTIDYIGCILLIGCFLSLQLPLNWAGTKTTWSSPSTIVPLSLVPFILLTFILWEKFGATTPLIPLHIFHSRTVLGVTISGFALGFSLYTNIFLIPQQLQIFRDLSPTQSALMVLPYVFGMCSIVFISAYFIARNGLAYPWLFIGHLGNAVAVFGLSRITPTSSLGMIVGLQLTSGIFSGCGAPHCVLPVAQAKAHSSSASIVTGVHCTVRLLAASLGVTTVSTVINNYMRSALVDAGIDEIIITSIVANPANITLSGLPQPIVSDALAAYARGFQKGFLVNGIITLVASIAVILLVSPRRLPKKEEELLEEANH